MGQDSVAQGTMSMQQMTCLCRQAPDGMVHVAPSTGRNLMYDKPRRRAKKVELGGDVEGVKQHSALAWGAAIGNRV